MIAYHAHACVHCGACTAHCPTGALHLLNNDCIEFSPVDCCQCRACLPACPCGALSEVTE